MKFKKLISIAVTAAMVFALAVPAFAFGGGDPTPAPSNNPDSGETEENTVSVESTIQTPTIKVTVPTTGAVILNPYQMKFTVNGDEEKKPFYSAPVICKNESDCDLDIAVKATAKAWGDVKIVAASDVATTDPGDKNVSLTLKTGKFAAEDSTDHESSPTVVTLNLEKADTEYKFGVKGGDPETPFKMVYSEDPTYFGFILDGTVNKNTEKVWTAADKVSVTIVLTFTPQAIAANA